MKSVWEFFNSLKLTVYLILAITGVTMAGSMVLYFRPEVFGDMDQDLLFHWLTTKGLLYPTYTWWLYLLVVLVVILGINTLVCTIERLPRLVRRYRDPLANLKDMEIGGDAGREFVLGDAPADALSGFLKGRGYQVFADGDRLYAEKNRWLPFIPYMVHAGIMVFMVGHLISGLYGYRHTGLNIIEGETVKSPAGDYFLRLDKVDVEYRPDGSLKNFGSKLTALKDGRVIKTGVATANKPMFVEGGAVYQRQFGQEFIGLVLQAEVKSAGFNNYIRVLKGASYVDIDNTGYRLSVDRFISDFAVDEHGDPYSQSEELANPAVLVTLYKAGRPRTSGWIFARMPLSDTFKDQDVGLKFADLDVRPSSTFDVNRDPSALLVLFASLMVMFGTITTLYFRRERVWATLDISGGRAQVICTDDELYERI